MTDKTLLTTTLSAPRVMRKNMISPVTMVFSLAKTLFNMPARAAVLLAANPAVQKLSQTLSGVVEAACTKIATSMGIAPELAYAAVTRPTTGRNAGTPFPTLSQ